MMKVKITRLDKSVDLPKYQTAESAAFDLSPKEDTIIAPKEIKLLKTGLIVEAPHGHFLLIVPRSSTPKKKGLMMPHSIGVVDRDYSGPEDELLIQVYNFGEQSVEIKKGERIAQGIFMKAGQIEWEEVDTIRQESRGGVGSTGGYNG